MNAFLSRVRNGLYSRLESEHFTAQSLIRMFWPLVLDQLFIFVIGILSVAMVSSAGEEQIAAVTLVGVIGSLSYALFSAISMGGSIVKQRAVTYVQQEYEAQGISLTDVQKVDYKIAAEEIRFYQYGHHHFWERVNDAFIGDR